MLCELRGRANHVARGSRPKGSGRRAEGAGGAELQRDSGWRVLRALILPLRPTPYALPLITAHSSQLATGTPTPTADSSPARRSRRRPRRPRIHLGEREIESGDNFRVLARAGAATVEPLGVRAGWWPRPCLIAAAQLGSQPRIGPGSDRRQRCTATSGCLTVRHSSIRPTERLQAQAGGDLGRMRSEGQGRLRHGDPDANSSPRTPHVANGRGRDERPGLQCHRTLRGVTPRSSPTPCRYRPRAAA
jgi:hypothetical protein